MESFSQTCRALYRLLQNDVKWSWTSAHKNAFQEIKQLLVSSQVLVHYDPSKELVLSCDASPYGLGAVFSQVMEDGSERPVAYASRTLAPAEKKYAKLTKKVWPLCTE